MPTITLFEYRKYQYCPSERDDFKDNILYLTDKTINFLEELNKQKPFIEINRKTIKPLNYVGIIRAGNLTFQIFPKLFNDDNYEEHKQTIGGNLLKMLSYTANLPVKEIDSAILNSEKNDLFEVFIHLFAKNLLKTIKSGLKREYTIKSDSLRVIKGKIDFKKYNNPAKMHIVPCRYYEFSTDNQMNRTLKYTCYLMSKTVSDFTTVRMLRSVTEILDQTTLKPVTSSETEKIRFTRLNRPYEKYIRICRIFLSNSTLILQASEIESFSLLIPMEKLFEQFITGILKENSAFFFGSKISIDSQRSIGTLVRDENDSELFRLKPDILLGYPVEAIIDTKYKLLDKNERKMGVSQSDIYQMYAYATKTDAKKVMLLYPEIFNEQSQDYTLSVPSPEGENRDVMLLIRAINLSYNLNDKKDWDLFINELRRIVNPLINV